MSRTDEEQIEVIKRYIQLHGSKILLAIVLVIAAYAGYQYLQKSRIVAKETASIYYSELASIADEQTLTDTQRKQFDEIFARLAKEYPSSRYAAYGAMYKAKLDVLAGQLDAAEQSLVWAKAQTKDADIKPLLNLRLARIKLAQEEYDAALTLLAEPTGAYAAIYEEVKGDVYLLKEEQANALLAYHKAKALLDEASADTRLLAMKIASIDNHAAQDTVFPREVAKP